MVSDFEAESLKDPLSRMVFAAYKMFDGKYDDAAELIRVLEMPEVPRAASGDLYRLRHRAPAHKELNESINWTCYHELQIG